MDILSIEDMVQALKPQESLGDGTPPVPDRSEQDASLREYWRLFDLLMCVVGGLLAIFSLCLCQLVCHLYVAFRSRANFLDS